jgi:hypothetical protein
MLVLEGKIHATILPLLMQSEVVPLKEEKPESEV